MMEQRNQCWIKSLLGLHFYKLGYSVTVSFTRQIILIHIRYSRHRQKNNVYTKYRKTQRQKLGPCGELMCQGLPSAICTNCNCKLILFEEKLSLWEKCFPNFFLFVYLIKDDLQNFSLGNIACLITSTRLFWGVMQGLKFSKLCSTLNMPTYIRNLTKAFKIVAVKSGILGRFEYFICKPG